MKFNLFHEPVRGGSVLGCSTCPLDAVPGIRKVKGLERVKAKKAFLWCQSPGDKENQQGLELVGPTGQLLWETLDLFQLPRRLWAIQNVLRCRPMNARGEEHAPTKQELKCCSVYNDEALDRNRQSAVVHLVLGDVAGTALFGREYKKDKPVFWHEPWNAYVVLDWHPSYILRQGGNKAGWVYYEWRDRLRAVRAILDHPGRFGYVKSQDYQKVQSTAAFDVMEQYLRAEIEAGRRISVDIEDGKVEEKPVVLCVGFGTGHYKDLKQWDSWQGRSYTVVLDHPQSGYSPKLRQAIFDRLKRLLEDPRMHFAFQNGTYDWRKLWRVLKINVRGYDYDTMYGTYLRHSFLRSLSLENQMYRFLPEFGDYKEIVTPWGGNLANAPIDELCLYNSADCDVTKRLEVKFSTPFGVKAKLTEKSKHRSVSNALMHLYIHAGFTLDAMEKRGPILDRENWARVKAVVPQQVAALDRQLQQIAEDPEFNPGSQPQVAWLLYDKLGLPEPERGRTTEKDALGELSATTGSPVPQLVTQRRELQRIESICIEGWNKSAEINGGELHTIWHLCGAATGRLRSGRGDRKESEGIVNLQNINGMPLLQNMLVSDLRFRIALEE